MKNPKPAPVVVTTICSLCGEGWSEHGDDPTTLDCIRLLRARVPSVTVFRPYVAPYVYPNTYPWWNNTTITCGDTTGYVATNTLNTATTTSAITYLTPRSENDDGPTAVAA